MVPLKARRSKQKSPAAEDETAADGAGGKRVVSGATGLMDEAWYVFNKAAQHLREGVEASLAPLGLRRRHYATLKELTNGEPSQQDLSDRIPVDRALMVKIIDDLEEFGLAARRQHRGDRRAYRVVLLPAGKSLLNEAERRVASAENVGLENLSPEERRQLAALCRKILGWEQLV